jgi:lipopolysaccharide transport system ATP-binding protein
MSDIVLRVNNLSKSYIKYRSEIYRFLGWVGFKYLPYTETKVLSNITFDVKKGETVGIVGQNGAGKSTLLKIIASTLKQSSGTVQVYGKISALLELGLGFHPELTGRQNCYVYGGLMGYTRAQMDDVIESIKEFTEIGDYFEQPVRTYSSGMQMRVAFSAATAFRPDIFIVDEALSVGDAYFQHKSFRKIREFREQGTTILFVSHDRGAVQSICDRAILLEKGELIKDGDPEVVLNYYNALIAAKENSFIKEDNIAGIKKTLSGNSKVVLENVYVANDNNEKVEFVKVGEKICLNVVIYAKEFVDELVVGFAIRDRLGLDVFGTNSFYLDKVVKQVEGGCRYLYKFMFDANLGAGSYSITIAAHKGWQHVEENYFWADNIAYFTVTNIDKPQFVGTSWLKTEIFIEKDEV